MKKSLLILLLTLLGGTTLHAYDAEIDGIYYNFSGDKAEVTRKEVLSGGIVRGIVSYSGVVDIPETITSDGKTYTVSMIGSFAFNQCTGLTKVVIPNSVTIIKGYAFSGCTGLSTVVMGEGVTVIEEAAFFRCPSLTSITIPSSVISIGGGAFSGCGLTKVIVPDIAAWCDISFNVNDASSNPLYIAHHLYSDETTEIKNLIIPEGVTSIGGCAFLGCTMLTNVSIPKSVTSIGTGAFQECSRLTSVIISSSMTSIGDYAFSGCTSLEEIYCHAEQTPTVYEKTFKDVDVSDVTLYVPRNSYQQYKEHPIWGKFDIAIGTGIKSLTPTLSEGEGEWFDLSGRKLDKPQRGINIIRYSDGTTKKVKN